MDLILVVGLYLGVLLADLLPGFRQKSRGERALCLTLLALGFGGMLFYQLSPVQFAITDMLHALLGR